MPNSENAIIVYGKPGCVQCDSTERFLKTKKIQYTKIDITVSEDDYDKVVAMGYQQVPVVITPTGDHWYGFRPDKLAEYV